MFDSLEAILCLFAIVLAAPSRFLDVVAAAVVRLLLAVIMLLVSFGAAVGILAPSIGQRLTSMMEQHLPSVWDWLQYELPQRQGLWLAIGAVFLVAVCRLLRLLLFGVAETGSDTIPGRLDRKQTLASVCGARRR
jgi:hypothetical protein